ncbi:cell division cycle protein 23 homolog isoform X1 [Acyrthosiphon pisum]|uniref:Cdc23 domain-containing protein n=1 Tax=Acyrthosiphon pisum TaxID=7029 RepID=A0A8R2A867_ACYPI|nr:cell division cycle protein 23 homolog isoform X1 [Acyrthosiphon pisum]|eukprot:XP_001950297.1 PREDICTED: cell division cycle protein 23 homolog [Acyrthosiphon pisum]
MANIYLPYLKFFKDPLLIKAELIYALQESRDRCLHQSTKFLSELMMTLKNIPPYFEFENENNEFIRFELEPAFTNLEDYLVYFKARAYYDLEDYPSCAHIAKYTNNSKSMFLHYMARYLSMHNECIYERTNLFDSFKPINMRAYMELLDELLILNVYGSEDDSDEESEDEPQLQEASDLNTVNRKHSIQEVDSTPKGRRCSRRPRSLRIEKATTTTLGKKTKMTKRNNTAKKVKVTALAAQSENSMSSGDHKDVRIKREDPYLLWLTAVMLKRIDRCDEAVDILVRAIQIQPCYWGAWIELSTLVKDLHMLDALNVRLNESKEHHWMHLLFIAHMYVDFQITDRALNIYNDIWKMGHTVFQDWPYMQAQLAIAHHNKREIATAIVSFKTVMEMDPFRIDNLDLLSNLMYVCTSPDELVVLSKYVASIDRYRQETLCVLGNMYSLKCDHAKSVLYFKKAVRINPFNVTAWTLLGHEYIEMKNSYAAIISYRQALKINIRDYRAWYGLGQIYELVKLPNYALFYFTHARDLRPRDYRMLVSLGDMFDRADRIFESMACFYKALFYDTDGTIMLKLAKFYDKYGDCSNELTREHFNMMNRRALKIGIRNRTTIELNLILSKIYLYLGHYYMDLHYYDRAISLAGKCRDLWKETETNACQSLGVTEHVTALLAEIEARAGSDSSLASTPGAIKARRFLFAL